MLRFALAFVLTVGLAAPSVGAEAQPGKVYRIGYLETSEVRRADCGVA